MIQINLLENLKQTHTQKKNSWSLQGKGWGRDKLGVWDSQMQTNICKTDKQGPTVEHSIQCPTRD